MKFTVNSDWFKAFEHCEESRKAVLTYAVICYVSGAEVPELSEYDRMIFEGVKETIDRQKELSEKRRNAGRKGGIASTTSNFAQAKHDFAQANDDFAQAKGNFAQAKSGFAQAKHDFAQANDSFAQAKGNFAQAKIKVADSLSPITPISSINNINSSINNTSNKEKVNKEKESKEKENNEKESPSFGKFILDFVDPLLADSFIDFLRYRSHIGKSLKTLKGIKARYNKLYKLCRGDPNLAKQIVEQTLEHEWQDFYKLRSESPGRTQEQTYTNDDYWNVDT